MRKRSFLSIRPEAATSSTPKARGPSSHLGVDGSMVYKIGGSEKGSSRTNGRSPVIGTLSR